MRFTTFTFVVMFVSLTSYFGESKVKGYDKPTRRHDPAELATEAKDEKKGKDKGQVDEFKGAEAISGLTSNVVTVFTSEEVDGFLPHRYPFGLVDKIVEYEAGKKAVGIKCVTKNEEYFNGHFPEKPVMPGVLQLEALAQLAGFVVAAMEGGEPGAFFFFAGADGVKWKKPVFPGDILVMEVEILKSRANFGIAKATGKGYVDGDIAVEVGAMTFAVAK